MRIFRKYVWLMIASAFFITSCKDVLDTEPNDFLTPSLYYETEPQLNVALNGVYDVMGNTFLYKQNLWNQLAIGTDIEYYGVNVISAVDARIYNVNSAYAIGAGAWNTLYVGINRANTLLAAMETSPVAAQIKTPIKAQALFLRGYYYFLLVDLYGGVPLRLKPTTGVEDANFPRSSVKDVYAQVLKDMTDAEAMLPSITIWGPSGSGRVSKTAAQGILSRVCLTMAGFPLQDVSKYKEARDWAQKVMTSGLHSLNPDYKQVFINLTADKYDTKECIWEVEFSFDPSLVHEEYGNLGYYGIKCGDIEYGFAVGDYRITKKLWDLYQQDAGDVRRDWNFAPYGFGATDTIKTYYTAAQIWERFPGKWRREYEVPKPKSKFYTPTNFPLLRYADVLLLFAEAENGLNGPTQAAIDAVNVVRQRAKATPYLLSNYSDKGAFLTMIQDERARELVFEGIRKRDLIRWGILVQTMQQASAEIIATAPSSYRYAGNAGRNTAAGFIS